MRRVLGVFAKEPRPGTVKSRLAAAIGPDAAARLYEAFLRDFLPRLESLPFARVLAFTPDTSEPFFHRLAGGRFELEPQTSGDLGERMAAFFRQRFEIGDKPAVLIGSDSPDLPLDRIDEAFRLLASHDLVLGPSDDGGYYLIGMSRMIPEIFTGIDWSTPGVFDQTMRQASTLSVKPALLEPWYDVDEPNDLRRLAANLAVPGDSRQRIDLPHTAAILRSLHDLL